MNALSRLKLLHFPAKLQNCLVRIQQFLRRVIDAFLQLGNFLGSLVDNGELISWNAAYGCLVFDFALAAAKLLLKSGLRLDEGSCVELNLIQEKLDGGLHALLHELLYR